MEFRAVNKEHKQILEIFTKEIEGFIYRITDNQHYQSFSNFKPVIKNAQTLHNNIGKELDNMKIDESEWVFMFPNYLLFAGIGFASAIKDNENEDYINDETEELFTLIHETINDLEQMLNKQKFLRERGEILKKQTIVKKQTK